VKGVRSRRRPKKRWSEFAENDCWFDRYVRNMLLIMENVEDLLAVLYRNNRTDRMWMTECLSGTESP